VVNLQKVSDWFSSGVSLVPLPSPPIGGADGTIGLSFLVAGPEQPSSTRPPYGAFSADDGGDSPLLFLVDVLRRSAVLPLDLSSPLASGTQFDAFRSDLRTVLPVQTRPFSP